MRTFFQPGLRIIGRHIERRSSCRPNPNARATFRKQLVDTGDAEKEQLREFHDVTPNGFARQFQEPNWVNEPAIAAIKEYGGT
ncbi:MAG TPA: hypothetical protein VHU84_01520 [Lacipirellulaceae bacterium]|nr:hypothetical protein [Lacipirellulaceae bacterium]